MIKWSMTMSICGHGCELHYAGKYRGVAVQFVRLPKGRAKSGERMIYVETEADWRTRPEHKTEAELVAAIDARLGNSEIHPKQKRAL